MTTKYNTFRLADDSLVKAFVGIVKDLNANENSSVNFRVDVQSSKAITCKVSEIEGHKELLEVTDLGSSVFIQSHLILKAPYNSDILVQRAEVSDTVSVNIQQELAVPLAARLLATTQKYFKSYERDESFDKLLGNELSEFYRKREQGLVRLEELSQKLIEQNEAYRQQLDQEKNQTRIQLQQEYQTRLEELQKENEIEKLKLKGQEEKLAAREKELDDRSSRHARRQIRQDLKSAIAQRNTIFSLTKQTTRKRNIIHVLFIILIGLLGYIVYLSIEAMRFLPGGTTNWYFYLKLPAATIGTVASIIYYIRWNDHWFKRHADEEFNIKRFELDIDRASWIVEMAMEWKDEKGSDIPIQLIDRLTTNLFDSTPDEPAPRHPSEDLASALLGASSELSLNVPGVGDIKVDRKGTRQFKKAIEKTD